MTTPRVPYMAVAVANGEYARLIPLPRAVPDTDDLLALLKDRHGFGAVLLADRRRGALQDEIDNALAPNALPGAALIVLWTGHGAVGPDGRLRLLVRTTDTADDEVATAGRLGEWAARTGATQVIVVLDTCFSGGGVPDALTMANAVLNGRADPGAAWFGVVAASRGDEPARSGAMARELIRLLTEGPTDPALQVRWNTYKERVRGDDLLDALVKEWSEPRHQPQKADTGNAWPMLRNPLYRPQASPAVVEHLLQAAHGTSTDQNFFTGRDSILASIVAWMRPRAPGLCVVTGPPGSGKSAILGRIVSASVPGERHRLSGRALRADLDPGESSVAAHLHARGLGHKAVVDAVTSELGLGHGTVIYDLLAFASRRRMDGEPLVVAIDGLDEAGQAECREIAVRVIEPLAREALVLVGTREVPGDVGEPGLLASLGTSAETVDLGTDLEGTLRDVHKYARRRLRGISPKMNPDLVADEIVQAARAADPASEGPFLLARLVTSQLRAAPVDTADPHWRSQVASTAETALEKDLQSAVLPIGGQPHPTAARELLHALTYAYGSGLPADDVWPAIATAISPTSTRYTRHDAYALLLILGRHIVAAAEGDQAVYRVAHQRLADHLRPALNVGQEARGLSPPVAQPIAAAVSGLYEQLLDEGQAPQQHTYLWRYTWRHLADAGPHGIELLRRFVARDRRAFLPDLADAMNLVTSSTFLSGSAKDAVTLAEELVSLRRQLDDPSDLATALFGLALARGLDGDADGAERAASEAVNVAREVAQRAHGDPLARLTLAAGFTTQAITHLRQGNGDGAWYLAVESAQLIEAEIDERPDLADSLAGACGIAARSALFRGDRQQADIYSTRALAALDKRLDDQRTDQAVLLETLQARAFIELDQVIQAVTSGGGHDFPYPAAAGRIVTLFREVGSTGTISDIHFAEGLRIFAYTSWLRMQAAGADDDAPDPVGLLDEAVALASQIADRSADGILALAVSFVTRAKVVSDPARALADLDEAERRLRPVATSSPLAAAQLGEVISMAVKARMADDAADLSSLIERQDEAVELLDMSHIAGVREVLVGASANLVQLLHRAGRTDEAIAVLELAVEESRALSDRSPSNAINLAAMLSDLAGGIAMGRPVEAINFATEAIEILQPLDVANPAIPLLRGLCEAHLSAAYLNLNRPGEARQSAERAIELLGEPSGPPIAGTVLATALNNLVIIHLAAEENEAALKQARRAVSLVEQPGPLNPAWLLPLVRINMGRALRALGLEAEAAEALKSGIAELRIQLTTDEETMARLAQGLNAAGPATWDTVLADLAASPEIAIQLALRRSRPPDELDLTLGTILDALRISGNDPALARSAREIARGQRSENVESFDVLWVRSAGPVPDWLSIDPSLSYLVVAWWNTDTPHRARDYMLANPSLLDPATDILIEEIRAATGDREKADLHLQIRADAAAHGIESAYAPALAQALINEWMDAADSEAFLTEHRDELLAPEVASTLARRRDSGETDTDVFLAVLVLTQRGEQAVAFQILQDPASGIPLLQPAWQSADAERLSALATLCRQDELLADPHRRLATVALAIGHAITGRPADAVQLACSALSGVTDDEQRNRLIGAISDALAYQPARQDELIELLRALRPGSDTPRS